MVIEAMLPENWEDVKEIYQQGIDTRNATLQTEVPSWEEWDKSHLSIIRYINLIDGVVAGWAALTPVSGRCVYAGVTELSVYVHEDFRGRGVGAALLKMIITASEKQNIWTLQSGIFPENKASIALHEKHGFRKIGFREKIGKLDGAWRDVILMERRSKITGQD
jgi:phosphinothricin acetyltransferase